MAVVHIRTISQSEKDLPPVILRVEAPEPSKLDLRFQATEGELQFKGKLKQKHLSDLRADAYKGSEEEWSDIIRHTFGLETSGPNLDAHLQSLQVTAFVDGKENKHSLKITFKRLVSGITQRLGEYVLKEDASLDIDTLPWTCTAVSRADKLQAEITSLEKRYLEAQSTISTLETRLAELVKAKSAHEDNLLSKFAQLLNEKKLKIRNQQRLLSTSQVNPSALQEVKDTLEATNREPRPSRKGKRPASDPSPKPQSDSSDDFETAHPRNKFGALATKKGSQVKNSVSPHRKNIDEDSDRHTTATDTDSEMDAERGTKPMSTSSADDEDGGIPAASSNTLPADEKMDVDEARQSPSPPPQRELPFARKGASADSNPKTTRKSNSPSVGEEDSGEETASATDDEL